MAYDLMKLAQKLGLELFGVSFHVGSQQTDPTQWEVPIGKVALLFKELKNFGVELKMMNLGGGFPAKYRTSILDVDIYTHTINKAIECHFNGAIPTIMIEPGRSLVADAGIIQSEVVLIAQKSYQDNKRWVFLDIGKFGGLAETMDECIKYRICTPWDGSKVAPVILAGPTCDSADILYEKANYELPINLAVGDKIQILSTGAYTSTYASVGFNGFPPLKTYCI